MADRSRYRVLMCGRRFGKTVTELLESSMVLLGQGVNAEATPYRRAMPVGWFAPTYKLLAEAWRDAVRYLGPAIKAQDKTEKRLELVTGGVLDFWSMDTDDPGRSRKYALVVVDEAGLQANMMQIWSEAIRPTLADYRGRALFAGTPKGMGGLAELWKRGEQGTKGWRAWRCPTTDNPYIDPAEIEEARGDMPEAAFRQEFLGEPASDGGNPFGLDHIRACVAPMSVAAPVVFGVDVAVEHDYTVIVGLDRDRNVCRFVRFNGGTWADCQARIIAEVGKVPTWIDATGVGAPIAEALAKVNPHTTPYKFTSASKQALMDRLTVAIQSREITFPDGPIAHELSSFQYQYSRVGTQMSVKFAAPHGLYDDCVCGLALAVSGFNARPEGVVWVNGRRYAAA